jgi:homoserine dehydrogenase
MKIQEVKNMLERAHWGVIGAGTIGGELIRQVAQPEVAERLGLNPDPDFIVNSKGSWVGDLSSPTATQDPRDLPDMIYPDNLFVTLPSSGDGSLAKSYIFDALERNKTAITAEKALLANHFYESKVKSNGFRRLGADATCGGGTRMPQALKVYTEQDPANVTQIHAVLNGTLSFTFSEIGPLGHADGVTRNQAVEQAVKLGYAEPGSETFDDVVKGEAEGDIPKKTSILFNLLELGGDELLDYKDLQFELAPRELARAAREARQRRFIVSFYSLLHRRGEAIDPEEEDIIGGFDVTFGGWQIVGGFQNINHEPLAPLGRITGPGNGALVGLGVKEQDGLYHVGFGPGAGPEPTVNTMLDNYLRLRRNAQNFPWSSR